LKFDVSSSDIVKKILVAMNSKLNESKPDIEFEVGCQFCFWICGLNYDIIKLMPEEYAHLI